MIIKCTTKYKSLESITKSKVNTVYQGLVLLDIFSRYIFGYAISKFTILILRRNIKIASYFCTFLLVTLYDIRTLNHDLNMH